MGGDFHVGSIVFFAIVVLFLLFRLRNVLGRRTGQERYRDPFARRSGAPPASAPVPGTPPESRGPVIEGIATSASEPAHVPLAAGLAQLKSADRTFDERVFLKGARGAFEIIVNAFAAGDIAALKPLLSTDVYNSFASAIQQRQAAKETHETNLMTVKDCDLVEAGLESNTAFVTVKFVSDQVNVTRAADGTVIDGDPDRVVEKTDFWSFSRDTRSRDPNWQLVATRSP
ncbi:MAG TPA: Tim44/TimA family putative adaptor protein [Stellaceae bacterium]|nr:Tim44/TimA family putative adaptor protein [Stellaceae bacterium]